MTDPLPGLLEEFDFLATHSPETDRMHLECGQGANITITVRALAAAAHSLRLYRQLHRGIQATYKNKAA